MQLIIMVGLLLAGVVLTKMGVIRQNRVNLANKWIIYVAVPAVAFAKIPSLELSKDLMAPALMPVLVFAGSAFFFYIVLGAYLKNNERMALTLLGGLGNTSFMGFPLLTFFYDERLLSFAVVFDQATFFVMATVAQYMIVRSEGSFTWKAAINKIILFPPFVAAFIAVFIPEGVYPESVDFLLDFFIQSITPIAMLVVGYQVARFVDFHFTRPVIFGITYKLLLAPFLAFLVLRFTEISDDMLYTCIMESAMATQITISILLLDKQILPKLTSQVLCWSILLSFLTVSFWYLVI